MEVKTCSADAREAGIENSSEQWSSKCIGCSAVQIVANKSVVVAEFYFIHHLSLSAPFRLEARTITHILIIMNPQQLQAIKNQEQLRSLIEQKQKLDSQVNEILMAKEEVDLLEDDALIYKLIGPLMVPQELKEVKETIGGRLKYLNEKIDYYEKEIKAKHTPV